MFASVQRALCQKKMSVKKFAELVDKSSECEYFINAVVSDQEGNVSLHVASVELSLPIFRESDCLNYLRYGSF